MGDTLDPNEITQILECEPTFAVRKGQDVESQHFLRPSQTGIWSVQLGKDEQVGSLDEQVRNLLGYLTNDLIKWERVSRGLSCELFIGVFLESPNQGFQVSAETLKECANRSLRASFDVYCTPND